ncbi:hypothetical protein FRB94_011811 [Tulasnella sp. JGI-2019a]|nr:hypothetical protein FRB93_002260 [Tulasnella sp. JGI-2019a]KAG9014633.1 hypothetical protein FRB94_011811 [Tulasnella sp. JGI-2019a]
MVKRSFATLSLVRKKRRGSTGLSPGSELQSQPAVVTQVHGSGIQVTASNGFSRVHSQRNPLQVQGRRLARSASDTSATVSKGAYDELGLGMAGSTAVDAPEDAATTVPTFSSLLSPTVLDTDESAKAAFPCSSPPSSRAPSPGPSPSETAVDPDSPVKGSSEQAQVAPAPVWPMSPTSSDVTPTTAEHSLVRVGGPCEEAEIISSPSSLPSPPAMIVATEPLVNNAALEFASILSSSPPSLITHIAEESQFPSTPDELTNISSPVVASVASPLPSSSPVLTHTSPTSYFPLPSHFLPIIPPSPPSSPSALPLPSPPQTATRPILSRSTSSAGNGNSVRFSQTFSPSPLSRTSIVVSGKVVKEEEIKSARRVSSADDYRSLTNPKRPSTAPAGVRGSPKSRNASLSPPPPSPMSLHPPPHPHSTHPPLSTSSAPSSMRGRTSSFLKPLKEDEVLELRPPPRPSSPASSMNSSHSSSSTLNAVPSTSRDPSENWLTSTSSPRFSRTALPSVVMPLPATQKNRRSLAAASMNRSSASLDGGSANGGMRRLSRQMSSTASLVSSVQSEPVIHVTTVEEDMAPPETLSGSNNSGHDDKPESRARVVSRSLDGHGDVAAIRGKVKADRGGKGRFKRFWKQLLSLS